MQAQRAAAFCCECCSMGIQSRKGVFSPNLAFLRQASGVDHLLVDTRKNRRCNDGKGVGLEMGGGGRGPTVVEARFEWVRRAGSGCKDAGG